MEMVRRNGSGIPASLNGLAKWMATRDTGEDMEAGSHSAMSRLADK
jgi:hypothetical protein